MRELISTLKKQRRKKERRREMNTRIFSQILASEDKAITHSTEKDCTLHPWNQTDELSMAWVRGRTMVVREPSRHRDQLI